MVRVWLFLVRRSSLRSAHQAKHRRRYRSCRNQLRLPSSRHRCALSPLRWRWCTRLQEAQKKRRLQRKEERANVARTNINTQFAKRNIACTRKLAQGCRTLLFALCTKCLKIAQCKARRDCCVGYVPLVLSQNIGDVLPLEGLHHDLSRARDGEIQLEHRRK